MIANECINFICLPDAVRMSPTYINIDFYAHTATNEHAVKAIHCTTVNDLILVIIIIIFACKV